MKNKISDIFFCYRNYPQDTTGLVFNPGEWRKPPQSRFPSHPLTGVAADAQMMDGETLSDGVTISG